MQNAISSKFSLYCHITPPSTHISKVQDLVLTMHIYIAHKPGSAEEIEHCPDISKVTVRIS